MMTHTIISREKALAYTSEYKRLESEIIDENFKLKLMPAVYFKSYHADVIRMFCHRYARYSIVTAELIQYLKDIIGNKSCIEIGAGSGDIGYHLGIKMTDNKMQDRANIQFSYSMMCQPTINYGKDIIKMDALTAVKRFKPKIVIASWVTQDYNRLTNHGLINGVKESQILRLVDTYILIGNLNVHQKKDIMKKEHAEISCDFLVSRASFPELDRIFLWNKSIK